MLVRNKLVVYKSTLCFFYKKVYSVEYTGVVWKIN